MHYADNFSVCIYRYYTFVYPYLIYCNTVWCVGPKVQLKQLYSIQKKIIRAITFSPPLTRSESLLRSFIGFLSIHEINVLMVCVIVFRCMNQDKHPCDHFLNWYIDNRLYFILTLYGPNLFFRRFSEHNLR